jgi:hypothetical protein
LRQDPRLVADGVRGVASVECPYRGLVPFDVGDADGFFGRDADVADCLRRLATTGVLAVVGPSLVVGVSTGWDRKSLCPAQLKLGREASPPTVFVRCHLCTQVTSRHRRA